MIAIILNRFDLCNRGKKSTLSCRQVSAIEIFYGIMTVFPEKIHPEIVRPETVHPHAVHP